MPLAGTKDHEVFDCFSGGKWPNLRSLGENGCTGWFDSYAGECFGFEMLNPNFEILFHRFVRVIW